MPNHPPAPIEPPSMSAALARRRELVKDINNIERQLAERPRLEGGRVLNSADYARWRAKAHSSLVFKTDELMYIKAWITRRRRMVEAGKLGVFDPDDPRELLVQARATLKKALAGDDMEIGQLYNMIDQYLRHSA